MIDFAVVIVSDFENQRIEPASDPANGTILLRNVAALVEVIWRSEELLGFFEADRALRIRAEPEALPRVETEPHLPPRII